MMSPKSSVITALYAAANRANRGEHEEISISSWGGRDRSGVRNRWARRG